jgi:hypothetical protein
MAHLVDAKVGSSVSCIRPLHKSLTDKWPYVIYETVSQQPVLSVNRSPSTFEAVIRFYFCTLTHNESSLLAASTITEICALGKYRGIAWDMKRILLDDQADVAQQLDQNEKPFYVKSIDFFVRARRITAS